MKREKLKGPVGPPEKPRKKRRKSDSRHNKWGGNSWYAQKVEPSIREAVKLLRNRGFNTTCSCGHENWIEGDGYINAIELHKLLFEIGYRDYDIKLRHSVVCGGSTTIWQIQFLSHRCRCHKN